MNIQMFNIQLPTLVQKRKLTHANSYNLIVGNLLTLGVNPNPIRRIDRELEINVASIFRLLGMFIWNVSIADGSSVRFNTKYTMEKWKAVNFEAVKAVRNITNVWV